VITTPLSELRLNYQLASLSELEVAVNPVTQFEQWFNEALQSQIVEPNAMVLCTSDATGQPHSRVVLLKELTAQDGFVFFTNYNSHKAQQLNTNSQVSLLFFWKELERQVRVLGQVHQLTTVQNEAYFHSRPKQSQIGAWASEQSQVIASRKVLDDNYDALTIKYPGDTKVPYPAHWGGYGVQPHQIEFWQGRASRLHDRVQYTNVNNEWLIERLSP
jgi:pyridoxamine 5'-phosphate oxidase